MKRILYLICLSMLTKFSMAQIPERMNYQGIARDNNGQALSNTEIDLKIGISSFADAREFVFEELHHVTTNNFGLYQLHIGSGERMQGEFKNIQWEKGNWYVHVSIKTKEMQQFESLGNTELLSVPYAFYAAKSGDKATRASNNYIEKTNNSGITNSTSLLYDNGTSIGLGTSSPVAGTKLHINHNSGNAELLRLQNTDGLGYGRFTMYNNTTTSYATFTKYGSSYGGGYAGITTLYPYSNLLAFGNNSGAFLISNNGNIGLSLFKGGSSKLKFHADFNTEYIGLGGSATPAANIHFNQQSNGDTLLITNNLSGHTINDGLAISMNGTQASIINKENNSLSVGTNNLPHFYMNNMGRIGLQTLSPEATLHIAGDADTSLFVTTTSANGIYNGIIRAEYLGSTIDDHVALFGRSVPDITSNSGIGIYGEGGYIGVQAFAKCKSISSVYGSLAEGNSRGETYGAYGSAQSDTTGNLGSKYGVYGLAGGGQFNYGVYGAVNNAGASLNSYAGFFNGKVNINGTLNVLGTLTKGSGTFKIDHPLDPANKYLYHSFVESPDMMNIYNGNCITDANGKAIINLPDYFEALNKEFRYQLTAIGGPAQIWIAEKIQGNQFVIQSDKPQVEISWQVTGIRKDPYAEAHRILPEVEKENENKGKYLYPIEAGQPESKAISPKAPSAKASK